MTISALYAVCLVLAAAAAAVTPAPLRTSASTIDFLTIPLRADSTDNVYNALVTDSSGNEMGLRLDILQPDVWLLDGDVIPPCGALFEHVSSVHSFWTVQSVSFSGRRWAGTECQLNGAFTQTPVATRTENGSSAVATSTLGLVATQYTSLVYPNGLRAAGYPATANLSLANTDNELVELDGLSFVLVNSTNAAAGGLGVLGLGLGFLSQLVQRGTIVSSGYLVFFSNYSMLNTSSAGDLLVGAVDKKYYSGQLHAFPMVPYAGLDSTAPLPIVMLDDLVLENANTSQQISLMGGLAPHPVVLDTRLASLALPFDYIVNLAIQTNAFYDQDLGTWIVKCSDIENLGARIKYRFGNLTVLAPLTSFIELSDAQGLRNLYFSNGVRACLLNVQPLSQMGYTSLGLPFLANLYLAVDNDGRQVALAQANRDLVYEPLEYDFDSTAHELVVPLGSNATFSTVAYIKLGHIPFAVLQPNATQTNVMTFFTANATGTDAVPTLFSNVTIISGKVYITGTTSVVLIPSTMGSVVSLLRRHSGLVLLVYFSVHWRWVGLFAVGALLAAFMA